MNKFMMLLITLGGIAAVVLGIIVWAHFANTPVSELPAWTLLFFR